MEGKGGRTRVVPVGEHAWRALDRYLARGRTALEQRRRATGAVPLEERQAAVDLGRAAAAADPDPAGPACRRTRCATRSPRTCWRAAPTCARSRSCWDTASISTTQTYTRVESKRLKKAYARSHPRA